VAQTGRNAQGVRLIRLSNDELLVGVVSVEAVEDEELIDALEGEEVTASESVIDFEMIADKTELETDLNKLDEE
jgi:DNA gyrase subunit A